MAIVGRYILTPDIFEILRNIKPDKGGEIQITDALKIQARQGKVIAYKFKGKRNMIKLNILLTLHLKKCQLNFMDTIVSGLHL